MQDKRRAQPKKLRKNERRADMQLIRTNVSQNEIYIWAFCLCSMTIILTAFVFVGLFIN